MVPGSDVLNSAFGGRAWRDAIDALLEATGLIVDVLDADAATIVCSRGRCDYCELATGAPDAHATCFGEPPEIKSSEVFQVTCRAGLPAYAAPVQIDDRRMCVVIVGGFVSSTRDRKRLFERLLARGVSESQARKAVREIPVRTKREVESLVAMTRAMAQGAVARALENKSWAERTRELEVFVEVGKELGEIEYRLDEVLDVIVARAMSIVAADGGSLMLLRPGTDMLEVVAARGDASRDALGAIVHVGDGIAGRVAATGRGVLVTGDRGGGADRSLKPGRGITTAVSVPLMRADAVQGVLNVALCRKDRRLRGDEMRLLERFADMAASVIETARGRDDAYRTMYELMHLGEFAKWLADSTNVEEIATATLSVMSKTFDFDLAGCVITGWGLDDATVAFGTDLTQSAVDRILGEATGRDVAVEPFSSVRHVTSLGSLAPDAPDEEAWSVMSVEIMAREHVMGYIFVAGGAGRAFQSFDHRLLLGMAEHASKAFERAAVDARVRDDYAKTVAALSATLDLSEHAAPGHAGRVMELAMLIGQEIGLAVEDIEVLRFAGLLHDIGKTGLSEEILLKPTKLNDDEMAQMRRHPEIGVGILEQIDFLDAVKPAVMHHHERWDGAGYPAGLAGEAIPLLARILAVSDAFDAITSEWPYRPRRTFAEARTELRASAGTQFDPEIVEALVDALDRKALAASTGLFVQRPAPEDQLPA